MDISEQDCGCVHFDRMQCANMRYQRSGSRSYLDDDFDDCDCCCHDDYDDDLDEEDAI